MNLRRLGVTITLTVETENNHGRATWDNELVAIFSGPRPRTGESHACDLLFASAELSADQRTSLRTLVPGDKITDLSSIQTDPSSSTWMLTRRQPAGVGAPVLVVEDNPINLAFYHDVLARNGYPITQAQTGAEALAAAAESHFALIFIDVRLPDANGFELSRSFRSMAHLSDTSIVLMSADPAFADDHRVVAAGADAFIVNPISVTDLDALTTRLMADAGDPPPTAKDRPTSGKSVERLSFFSPSCLVQRDSTQPLPRGRGTELLAMLALSCPSTVTTERLTRFAWPNTTRVSPNAVYTAMSRLRQSLGTDGLITTDDDGYALALTPDQVDLSQFEARARLVLRAPHEADTDEVDQIVQQWTGPPFPSTQNVLLQRWSTRLAETRALLLETLAFLHVLRGSPSAGSEVCSALLDEEPWREAVWALRIVALYRSGRANDALHEHALACQRLRSELGLDPGPLLESLELMVLSHDPLLLDETWLTTMPRQAIGFGASSVEVG